MPSKKKLLSAAVLIAAFLITFDVDFRPEFSMSQDVLVRDVQRENEFSQCVEELDRQIHADTFGSIDNPDVQREILMTRKERAVVQCRERYPELQVTIGEPFRFNIIDLAFRY